LGYFFFQGPRAIDDSPEAIGHHRQNRADAGEQKHRCDGELDDMGDRDFGFWHDFLAVLNDTSIPAARRPPESLDGTTVACTASGELTGATRGNSAEKFLD
jgi:hypothetical protein